MTVIGQTADGKKIVLQTATGPASYTTGGFNVTINELDRVDAVLHISIDGGYKIGSFTITGNTVKVVVHQYSYTSATDGPSAEVPATTNLSTATVTIIAVGT